MKRLGSKLPLRSRRRDVRARVRILSTVTLGILLFGSTGASVEIEVSCGNSAGRAASPAAGAPTDERPARHPERPTIGLVLSGGGARGAAHVGVLEVLERLQVPVDYVVGTSMGAIIGGLYASGMSAGELKRLVSETDWTRLFDDRVSRKLRPFRRKRDDDLYLVKNSPGISWLHLEFPPGVLDGRRIDLLLKRLTLPVVMVRDFDALPVPYRAVATDLTSGQTVILQDGDLALAMRASMSIPVIFAPRQIEGRILVDGGLSDNLPIEVARQMGAEVIIAVDVTPDLREKEELQSVLDVTDQLTTIMTRRNMSERSNRLGEGDVLIQPQLDNLSMASFERSVEAIAAGSRAAAEQDERLGRLARTAGNTRKSERVRTTQPPVIDQIRIHNQSRLKDEIIASRLGFEGGKPLDVERLERGLDRVYALGLFESVSYDVLDENGDTTLLVRIREASRGPGYLQFGMAVFEDFDGLNFELSTAYLRTAINRLNGEWRTGLQIGKVPGVYTEFYQPVHESLSPFVHARGWVGRDVLDFFDADGKKIEEFDTERWGIGIAGGFELGTWGEARAGVVRESGERELKVGEPGPREGAFARGETFVQFRVDELDDVSFPHSGGAVNLRLGIGLEALGSDVAYEQGEIEGSFATSLGENTLLVGGRLATSRKSDAPLESLFRLGGFTRLSGLEQDELSGQHAALLAGSFYRQLQRSRWASLYAGFSGEYGNVVQDKRAMRLDAGIVAGSVFMGLESPMGPVFVAYGIAEGGRRNFYFFLGQPLAQRRAELWHW